MLYNIDMNITESIVELLKIIAKINNSQVKKYLHSNNSIKLFSGNKQLIEIDEDKVKLGEYDITEKLLAKVSNFNKKLDYELKDNKYWLEICLLAEGDEYIGKFLLSNPSKSLSNFKIVKE